MWGGLFVDPHAAQRQRALALLRDACKEEGVWPYFVPAGGFMMTPPMDIEESEKNSNSYWDTKQIMNLTKA